MKMRILLTFLVALLISNNANAFSGSMSFMINSNTLTADIDKTKIITNSIPMLDDNPTSKFKMLAAMKISQIEHYLGRKLKFKEKLAFKVLKIKANKGFKNNDEVKSQKGKTSLTLGILALVTLFIFPLATIPLGILAITNGSDALKTNPNDRDGKAGKTMGIISLAVLAFALIALVAFLKVFVVY